MAILLTSSDVATAASVLRSGGLVALPTETVYGLAADARNEAAVRRIYAAKGRPLDHPVIVHIADATQVSDWASDFPAYAQALAEAFWPGPMTLVLPRNASVGDWITGGQDTVAVRVPDHAVALEVLQSIAGGVAAPSANQFGKVSPTSAQHVLADLGSILQSTDAIIDGGDCVVGVESSIIDCTGAAPRILRPGAISTSDVERVTGLSVVSDSDKRVRVPGALDSHYAPRAQVIVVENEAELFARCAQLESKRHVGVIAPEPVRTPSGAMRLAMPESSTAYAECLYRALREADRYELEFVVALAPTGDDVAVAVRDRLTRAAHA